MENPLFGHGWGSARCHDLIFLLLATAGLFGFIPFASFIGSIAYKLNRLNFSLVSACRNNVYITYFSFSFFVIFVTTLFSNTIAGFSYVFASFWLILGMCLSLLSVVEKRDLTEA